jgi:hypothetical protein
MGLLAGRSLVLVLVKDPPKHPLVMPALPGSTAEHLVARVIDQLDGCVLAFPMPENRADHRLFHSDVWTTLVQAEREAVGLVAGPTAMHFVAVAGTTSRVVTVVDEPVAALLAYIRRYPPARRALKVLQRDADDPRAAAVVNPQSAMLLGPWIDSGAIPLSPTAEDSARWAGELAALDGQIELFSADASRAVGELFSSVFKVIHDESRSPVKAVQEKDRPDLLIQATWLDQLFYEHAVSKVSHRRLN